MPRAPTTALLMCLLCLGTPGPSRCQGAPGADPADLREQRIFSAMEEDEAMFSMGLLHAAYVRGLPYNAAAFPDSYSISGICDKVPKLECSEDVYDAARRQNESHESFQSFASSRDPLGSVDVLLPATIEVREGMRLPIGKVGELRSELRRGNTIFTSQMKLEHDAGQLEHLVGKGVLPLDFLEIARVYRATVSSFVQLGGTANNSWFLDRNFHEKTHFLYGGQTYLPPPSLRAENSGLGSVLRDRDWTSLEGEYRRSKIVVIDDLLEDWARQELFDYCLDATVYHEVKPNYVGAYAIDGLSHPLLLRISKELRLAMPNVVGDLPLENCWSYRFGQGNAHGGVKPHCDVAVVNVNMWLTPDEANLDQDGGGLRVYTTEVAANSIQQVNTIAGVAFDEDSPHVDVPYRCNRAVIFDSSLLHATMPQFFKNGYRNQRINLTFLFGKAERWEDM